MAVHARVAASEPRTRLRPRRHGVVVAAALGIEVLVVATALHVLVGWPHRLLVAVIAAAVLAGGGIAAATSANADARARRLIRPVIVGTGLTTLVAAVYVLVVVGLGRPPTHDERTLLVLSLVAAAASALLVVPARRWLDDLATRLVQGSRGSPADVLSAFGARLSRAIPLEEVLLQLVELLRRTLDVEAEVWTRSEDRLERVVSDPDLGPASLKLDQAASAALARGGVVGATPVAVWLPEVVAGREDETVRVAPIVHAGELFGLVVVQAADAEGIDADVEDVLAELGRRLGLVLRNVRLDSELQLSLEELRRRAEELQASRVRIVEAADTERRRIERDLHDGAQQHLVGLAANLASVRKLIGSDPDEAKNLVDLLQQSIEEAMQAFRDLAHGVYPPLLEDRGLGEALNNAARSAAIRTRVEAAVGRRYDPRIERTVYFCCLESLQNAAKHAGDGARATIRIREDDGTLVFEVADDGVGLDPARARRGAGLTNMQDRLAAVGGSLRVDSAGGAGTTVVGTIPVER